MLRKLGIPVLAMAAALTAVVPSVTLARDRDDHSQAVRRDVHFDRDRDRGRDWGHDRDGRGSGWNVGVYAAPVPVPAPAPSGYYDQYGVWHPYTYYPNGYNGY